MQAAAAGKHVIVEKPIDVTLERAQALIDACDRHGVRLGVIFQSRFMPAVALIKRAIDRGRLGRLYVVDAYVKWFRTAGVLPGGALAGHQGPGRRWGAHQPGDSHRGPGAVLCRPGGLGRTGYTSARHHPYIEGEDTALALVQLSRRRCRGHRGDHLLRPGFARRVEVHGERGSIILDGNDVAFWQLARAAARRRRSWSGCGRRTRTGPMARPTR